MISNTKFSLQFLSRIPVSNDPDEVLNFQQSAYTFPLAGLIIALPAAAILWGASFLNLPTIICALLAVAALILTTGGLHEDGLADVADGFGGGHDKTRKLEIMRDSAVGTYGVLALVLSVGLKTSLLSYLLALYGGASTALLLIAVTSLSRFAILQPWAALPSARSKNTTTVEMDGADEHTKPDGGGLSARYGLPDMETFTRGVLYCLPAALILLFTVGPWAFVLSLITAEIFILAFARICEKQIGGHTGDTLGATQQLSELGLLLGLATLV